MQVASYLFQSPSTSQVQVGKLDPNSKQDSTQATSTSLPNETLTKAQNFQATQTSEVTPKIESSSALLDVYA